MIAHPATYRVQQVKVLARWVATGESSSVVGLPGCGRSNLLDFLCQQPEVLQAQLPTPDKAIVLIPVDLKNLPASDLSTLYRVILRSFYWERHRFDETIGTTISQLYTENRGATDPFLAQTALYDLLFAVTAANIQTILVLNRFDYFCQTTDNANIVNNLRSLRDNFKNTLCFIVGMRQEVAYLPDSDAFGDMYELFDTHVCWVGAMEEDDARHVLQRATTSAKTQPSEEQIQTMMRLSGNFPVLLKAIGYWWINNRELPIEEWSTILVNKQSFDYRLARLWESLNQEEQFAVAAVREWQLQTQETKRKSILQKTLKTLEDEHGSILAQLEAKGVIEEVELGWNIKGELLDEYVRRVGPSSRGRIRLDKQTEEIYQGLTSLRHLPPLEDKLLRVFINQPYKRHTYSALIEDVFSGDARNDAGEKFMDRTRQDLFPLIRNLRKKIEANTAKPCYIINWTGNPEGGYQFFPEGRPD